MSYFTKVHVYYIVCAILSHKNHSSNKQLEQKRNDDALNEENLKEHLSVKLSL